MVEPDELPGARVDRSERKLERAVDVRGGDALHALERLDPALHLLRLGGFGPEAIHETLQVRNLPLLLHVSRLLRPKLERALALELGVVAGIHAEFLDVEVDDRVHHAVEEVPIVGDEQERAGKAREPVLEP